MRSFMALIVAVALLIFVTPVIAQNAADETAIREATKQTIETINKGDVKGHVALYAYPNETFSSTRDIATHEKDHMDSIARGSQSKQTMLDEIALAFLTPDVAIHKYRMEAAGGVDGDGKPLPPRKSYVARVYVKIDGNWLTQAYFSTPIEE